MDCVIVAGERLRHTHGGSTDEFNCDRVGKRRAGDDTAAVRSPGKIHGIQILEFAPVAIGSIYDLFCSPWSRFSFVVMTLTKKTSD